MEYRAMEFFKHNSRNFAVHSWVACNDHFRKFCNVDWENMKFKTKKSKKLNF